VVSPAAGGIFFGIGVNKFAILYVNYYISSMRGLRDELLPDCFVAALAHPYGVSGSSRAKTYGNDAGMMAIASGGSNGHSGLSSKEGPTRTRQRQPPPRVQGQDSASNRKDRRMATADLMLNDTEQLGHDPHIPEAHAVLEAIFGSTLAELLLVQQAHLAGVPDPVPWRGVVVDAMPYEALIARLVQNGWTEKQAMEAIPRSHYFHLAPPFSKDFDFDNPLNRKWLSTIFEPELRRLATMPNAPGCNGTPAMGRARVEGNEQDLGEFFRHHLQELTQVRTETLALLDGVKVFVITTYRGGVGTGATTPGAAVLRSVMEGGQIHLHAIMPCVYGGDERTYANAYAMPRENQYYHRYNGRVPMQGDRLLKAPFDTATYVFASNGAVALGPVDALMQEAAIMRAYLRASTQAAINARHVDCAGVIPWDLQDNPMHVRVETALAIRTVPPGTQEYVAAEWLRQELKVVQDRFEAWLQDGELTSAEELQLRSVVEDTIKDLNLRSGALLARLEPSPTPTNALRSFLERATGMLGSMPAKDVKQSMASLPTQVHDAFLKFEGDWKDGASKLAVALPREVTAYVMRRMPAARHVGLAAMERIRGHLARIATEAAQEAEQAKRERDAANARLGPALNAVQEAHGILGFIRADEVTRDAAHTACGIALAATTARAEQQRRESLVQALEVGMSTLDSRGQPETIPPVTVALRDFQSEQVATVRRWQATQLKTLQEHLDELGQRIEKRSQVFQRSLLYDGMTRKQLGLEVRAIRAHVPNAPPVAAFLEGQQTPQEALTNLLPLLPSYAQSGRSLTESLLSDPGKQRVVVPLLRNCKPYTPIDREVEDQQDLRNRRDNLTILELPGGQDGPLAQLMLRERIVTRLDQVVEAGDDEIRLYFLRDGLPYAAMSPLARYKERHDRYLENPAAITPYTVPNAHQLPGIEPARTNLREHTQALLYTGKAVLPDRVALRPTGDFLLCYDANTSSGSRRPQEESFTDFADMVTWVAKRAQVRKALEAELELTLNNTPDACKAALIAAWQKAGGAEREYLYETLCRLKVDLARFPGAGSGNHQPAPNATAASRQHA